MGDGHVYFGQLIFAFDSRHKHKEEGHFQKNNSIQLFNSIQFFIIYVPSQQLQANYGHSTEQ
jgi:hypothetical protein